MRRMLFLCLLCARSLAASASSVELGQSLEALAKALQRGADEQEARLQLSREAAKLREDGEAHGAELLEQLSRGAQNRKNKPQVVSSSSSVESHTFIDQNGHKVEVRRQKNCRNGVCSEQTQTAQDNDEKASVPATSLAADMHQGSEAQSFEAAARRVTQQVKAMEKQFDDSFKFDDLIQPVPELFWNHFREGTPMDKSEHKVHTESMSEETVVQNGHAVHQTRRCKNGKCQTTLEEGDIAPKSRHESVSHADAQDGE